MSILQSLRKTLRRKTELAEELESHLRMAVADRVARGESTDEARKSALREFGNVPLIADVTRERWGGIWMDSLQADVSFGWRQLWKRKVTTLAAVVSLALGIGSCMAAFRLVDALFLRPMPAVEDPSSLYAVTYTRPATLYQPASSDTNSYLLFEHERDLVDQHIADRAQLAAKLPPVAQYPRVRERPAVGELVEGERDEGSVREIGQMRLRVGASLDGDAHRSCAR